MRKQARRVLTLRRSVASVAIVLTALVTMPAIGCARIASRSVSVDGGATDWAAPSVDDGGGATAGSEGGSACRACSADLRAVTDCQGGLLQTCPDGQACAAGSCVDACAMARASGSAQGCEFYSVIPPTGTSSDGLCFAVMLANTWTDPITIMAEYDGQTLDVASVARTPNLTGQTATYDPLPGGRLAPGQMAILFLNANRPTPTNPIESAAAAENFIECPIAAGITAPVALRGSAIGHAFRISTSAPVVAYDIYPFGGAKSHISSATLLVPTSAWGTNYLATDGYRSDPAYGFHPSVQIVAAQDNTHVTVNPAAPITGGPGVAATAQGSPQTYTLSRGQLLQFAQPAELAGSSVSADNPIGVWGGASCMFIPTTLGACDAAHQQLVPVNLLGHQYVAARYRDRIPGNHEIVPWTLIGAVDGTVLTYDPAKPANAPAMVDRGQSFEFKTSEPFTVTSADEQHPFYLAGHMTGYAALGDSSDGAGGPGDPETVNTVPPQQWLSRYLFLTDPTYGNTNLVFVRQRSGGTFVDVTLDCVGPLTGWMPVGTSGDFEFTTVDLVVATVSQGACRNGVHVASSTRPFGLTVWGWDFAVSYAYPAGMSVQKINDVVIP